MLKRISLALVVTISIGLLFLGFYRNQWGAVNSKKFNTFQRDVESYVLARLVLSRQAGWLAEGGLLGWGDLQAEVAREADYEHQYETYFQNQSFVTYTVKQSHPGFQAFFFSVLDRSVPLAPVLKFRLYHALASALLALVLAGLVAWFYLEFGLLSALLVLVSLLASVWLTLFGRNLFFFTWFFYLPMLVGLFWFRQEKDERATSHLQLFGLVFGLIFFKCLLNGYDFMLPTLGMTATPLVFYALCRGWEKARFFQRFLVVVAASLVALLASFLVLSLQVALATGDFSAGVEFILSSIFRRTTGVNLATDPVVSVSWAEILKIYLVESYLNRLYVPIYGLIGLFVGASLLFGWAHKRLSGSLASGWALVWTTWFSLLAPLSWYLVFKSLAYYHTHMNHLPWLMPFTLFGFGLTGFVLQKLLQSLIQGFSKRKTAEFM